MLHTLALIHIRGVGSARARHLIEAFGSAKNVFEADDDTLLAAGHIGRIVLEGKGNSQLFESAKRELDFIEAHHIQLMKYGDAAYPSRLLDCPDAPSILFKLGGTDLEHKRVLSIVGTRQCTQYGRDLVHRFIQELHEAIPDLIVVSGLALGIDVEAHKAALANQVPTVGVVAHGLDRIYPSQHRQIAKQMLETGGSIITEYFSGTQPERGNFLARNRIIAGLSDAVIVAESNATGGSLVTASIALDYNREVFAFPGRVGDARSEGCNRLIRLNRAGLITSANDFIEAMNWQSSSQKSTCIQHTINFEEDHLSSQDRLILDTLRDRGDMRLSQLSDITNIDHTSLTEALLDLEMEGKIRTCPGGLYQIR